MDCNTINKIMKKLETQTGYYRNGDIFSKIVCLPDNANLDDWKLVSDEEYNEWMKLHPKEEEFTVEQ